MNRLIVIFHFILIPSTCFSQSGPIRNGREITCILPIFALPEFPGGHKAMIRFIKTHLKYPKKAIKDGIEGTVVIKFLIDKRDKLSQFQIIKSLSTECDNEVIRVFKLMPKWKPGKDVYPNSYFLFPITFKL